MLVLSRKINQSFTIGQEIEVTVTRIEHDCVRIGIRAPTCVPIYRTELQESIQKSNQLAAEALSLLATPALLQSVQEALRTPPFPPAAGQRCP